MTIHDTMPIKLGPRTTGLFFHSGVGEFRGWPAAQMEPRPLGLVAQERRHVDERRQVVFTAQLSAWFVAVVVPNDWTRTEKPRRDPRVQVLASADDTDFEQVASQVHDLVDDALVAELVELIADEQVDPDTRSMVLEALATAQVPGTEKALADAIRAGLADECDEVVFTAISCLPTLSLARRASFRVMVEDLASRSEDPDVKRAARAFLEAT